MKKSQTKSKFTVLSLVLVLICSVVYANPGRSYTDTKMQLIMSNYEHSLNSDNPGVRMSTVEHVGRYKMSNFENILIELLKSEQNTENKKIIALSLIQLGTFSSIETVRKSSLSSDDEEYKEYCSGLFKKYWEYDKLRTEYFEDLVVYTFDIN